jgi:hypothetical protein
MAACTVCGLAACGLASHQRIARTDTGSPDPRDVSEGYSLVTRELAKAEVIRKHAGNLVLAERAEARLSELRKADPLTSYEQAVAVVLGEDPGLYQP